MRRSPSYAGSTKRTFIDIDGWTGRGTAIVRPRLCWIPRLRELVSARATAGRQEAKDFLLQSIIEIDSIPGQRSATACQVFGLLDAIRSMESIAP